MGRWNYKEIFQREYDAAIEAGYSEDEAGKQAYSNVQDRYYDRVDEGKQRAKDGEK